MSRTSSLSIIMPCFNSQKTVTQSVASIYRQNLQIPFEVIIIDDGSTDDTNSIISSLQHKYKHIIVLSHKLNMGGGKSRNDAIAKSKGNLIFCLDSDDVLPDNMLNKLIAYQQDRRCDGVIFSYTKYFMWSTHFTKILTNKFDINRAVVIGDLFSGESSFFTQVNFLYTKEAFEKTGGYPEDHGFDTQGFGFRFLAKSLNVYMCPDTYYYHRQGMGKSYFEREYELGKLSINYYLILEKELYLFSDQIISEIINYDIFQKNDISGENLMFYLKERYMQLGDKMFSGICNWKLKIEKSRFSGLLLFIYTLQFGNLNKSRSLCVKLISNTKVTPILFFLFLKCMNIDAVSEVRFVTLQPRRSLVSQSLPIKFLRGALLVIRRKYVQ